jgi:hypothetical protein
MFTAIALAAVIHGSSHSAPSAHRAHLAHVRHENHLAHLAYEKWLSEQPVYVPAPPVAIPVQQYQAPVQQTPTSVPQAAPAPASGYQAAVAQVESSGNPNATNGDHWGLYQMTPNLWVLGGGSASSYGSASTGEQGRVFQNIVANNINGGTSNWTPYDGVQP